MSAVKKPRTKISASKGIAKVTTKAPRFKHKAATHNDVNKILHTHSL